MATISHITSTNELRQASRDLTTLKGQFTSTLQRMDGIIRNIDNFWDGPASEAFKAKYDRLKRSIGNYDTALTQYKGFLDEAAVDYENTDSKVGGETSNLEKHKLYGF